MLRSLIAFFIICYALAFTFAAVGAVRWPNIALLGAALGGGMPLELLAGQWRAAGLTQGTYFVAAAFLFYLSALGLGGKRRPLAISFWLFLGGCAAGFPLLLSAGFSAGWWQDPSAYEGLVAGAGLAALLLALAIRELRLAPEPAARPVAPAYAAPLSEAQPAAASALPRCVQADSVSAAAPRARPRPRRPVPPAVAATRAQFARDGARMLAKQAARHG